MQVQDLTGAAHQARCGRPFLGGRRGEIAAELIRPLFLLVIVEIHAGLIEFLGQLVLDFFRRLRDFRRRRRSRDARRARWGQCPDSGSRTGEGEKNFLGLVSEEDGGKGALKKNHQSPCCFDLADVLGEAARSRSCVSFPREGEAAFHFRARAVAAGKSSPPKLRATTTGRRSGSRSPTSRSPADRLGPRNVVPIVILINSR